MEVKQMLKLLKEMFSKFAKMFSAKWLFFGE